MSAPEKVKEADRVMVICNSCRYCEGYCAVFPAMERRRTFTAQDLKYLANLCHNCRGCYYACQYAPPHEFDVNVPKTLGELRLDTYLEFTWPEAFKGLFRQNGLAVALIATLSVLFVLFLTLLFKGFSVFEIHTGENAFYRIIPYWAMVAPLSALGLFVLAGIFKGIGNFGVDPAGPWLNCSTRGQMPGRSGMYCSLNTWTAGVTAATIPMNASVLSANGFIILRFTDSSSALFPRPSLRLTIIFCTGRRRTRSGAGRSYREPWAGPPC